MNPLKNDKQNQEKNVSCRWKGAREALRWEAWLACPSHRLTHVPDIMFAEDNEDFRKSSTEGG